MDPLVTASQTKVRWLGMAALLLLTVIVYIPTIADGGFIWDDDDYVTENEHLEDIDGLMAMWKPRTTKQYYPLVFTTFWIEYQSFGLNPRAFHITNILLHALNAVMLWIILTRLRIPGAWLIAAIFAIHPMHVESVAWITERKNVLSAFLYLTSAWAYLRFDDIRRETPGSRDTWGWYGLSLVLFLGALLSKTVTCSLPAALILVMLLDRQRMTPRRWLPLLPMFAMGLALALNTASLEQTNVGAIGADFDHGLIDRALIASRALLFYPWKILWPWPVMFIYPRWSVDGANALAYWPLLIVLPVIVTAITLYRRDVRGPAIGLAYFAGTVFPAIGFFNVYPHRFSFVADHFAYLASIGVIAVVVAGVVNVLDTRRRIGLVAAPILLVLMVISFRQAGTYHDAESVWRDTLSKNPDAWMPHSNMASLLLRKAGRAQPPDDLQLINEAEFHATAAVRLKPGHHTAHANLAEAYRMQQRIQDAIEQQMLAIDAMPHITEYHWGLGRLYELQGDYDLAIAAYRTAADEAPASILFNLDAGRVLLQRNDLETASIYYAAAIAADSSSVSALGTLGAIRAQQGRHADAAGLFRRAMRAAALRGTSRATTIDVAVRLLGLLASSPDPAVRDLDEAEQLARFLLDLSEGQDPMLMQLAAGVLADQGRRDEALAMTDRAIDLARRQGRADLVTTLESQRAEMARE